MGWCVTAGPQLRSLLRAGADTPQQGALAAKGSQLRFLPRGDLSWMEACSARRLFHFHWSHGTDNEWQAKSCLDPLFQVGKTLLCYSNSRAPCGFRLSLDQAKPISLLTSVPCLILLLSVPLSWEHPLINPMHLNCQIWLCGHSGGWLRGRGGWNKLWDKRRTKQINQTKDMYTLPRVKHS